MKKCLIGLGIALLTSSCQSMGPLWSFSLSARNTQFQAKDGQYFPEFIHHFFPRASYFEREHPTLHAARQGVQVIEVRPVNREQLNQNESNLSWSANGAYLSYETLDSQNRHIMLRELGGRFEKKLAMVPRGQQDFLQGFVSQSILSYNSGLSWAYDGKRYAFMSNGGVGVYNIYVGSVSGSEEIVAQSSHKEGYAVWNPNRSELAFVSARTGQGDLYLLDLGQNRTERLTFSDQPDLFPEWLKDGSGLVYASGPSSRHQIKILHRNSSQGWFEPRALTEWNSDSLRPKASPCGNWLAFYSSPTDEVGNWNLHVIPVDTPTITDHHRSQTLVAHNVVVDLNTGPAWSPDGKKIFYVKQDAAAFNPIYAYDLTQKQSFMVNTGTRMNRDILMSSLGVLSFRAQVGAWDRVFVALTNQGQQFEPGQESLPQPITDRSIFSYLPQLSWPWFRQHSNEPANPSQRTRL